MKIVIYNDTTHAFGLTHFGCQLVMESLRDLLSDFEILNSVSLDDARQMKWPKILNQADLVIANGEGSFHHNRRPDFVELARRYPVALINTVYDSNDHTAEELSRFRYIAVRESASAAVLSKKGIECHVVPDVIFTSQYLASVKSSNGGGVISVDHFKGVRTLQNKEQVVPIIASSDVVYTGSFHGACVAMYYDKPVVLWRSNTHKMQGLAKDAGLVCANSESDAKSTSAMQTNYCHTAKARINGMINDLRAYE